ncbi:Cytosine deaminase-related metal-dependent hydrolase [Streptomyces venezuelae]|uniref:DUF7660 family protein n=1 Tax=Streptomyces gardneri TaxID=66892 RepID=UPI0007227612|nr:hypothetical protein [Streptomyces gardneri]ALO13464.1 Cytosine deaminase-related metal-dependent hydrolase [Streptomyces venezuelae]WRK41675.1 hypothetical protein U0M97_39755 [Streptomyces venezuelae]
MLLLIVKGGEALAGGKYLHSMPLTPDDEVLSRDELVALVRELRQDYLRRGHEWENQSLDHFLEALAAWIDDSPGWYRNFGKQLPEEGDWTFLARALQAATVYE